MKIRTRLVANSSSSSFILFLKSIPKTRVQIKELFFPRTKDEDILMAKDDKDNYWNMSVSIRNVVDYLTNTFKTQVENKRVKQQKKIHECVRNFYSELYVDVPIFKTYLKYRSQEETNRNRRHIIANKLKIIHGEIASNISFRNRNPDVSKLKSYVPKLNEEHIYKKLQKIDQHLRVKEDKIESLLNKIRGTLVKIGRKLIKKLQGKDKAVIIEISDDNVFGSYIEHRWSFKGIRHIQISNH